MTKEIKDNPETLIIDRKKWGTGNDGGGLLNEQTKKMCCLGFYALKKGFTKDNIKNKSTPTDLCDNSDNCGDIYTEKLSKLLTKATCTENAVCNKLINTNDSSWYIYKKHPEKREAKIKTLFKKINVNVEFTGTYPSKN